MSISSYTNKFWLFLFLQQRQKPQRRSRSFSSPCCLSPDLKPWLFKVNTVGNYAPLIIYIYYNINDE